MMNEAKQKKKGKKKRRAANDRVEKETGRLMGSCQFG